MKRATLVAYLDRLLRTARIEDGSKNGLQVEGVEEVETVAFAVDACQAAFARAANNGAQLLILHHGIFWSKPLVLTGLHYRRVKTLLDANVNVYAAHLPLDSHPTLGNNAELARAFGLLRRKPFGKYGKDLIGFSGELPRRTPLRELVKRLERATGCSVVKVFDYGPAQVRTVGCISGGAADMLDQAHRAGLDLYVTGEAKHGAQHEAAELKMNVIFGGHYATEVLGLKALARHLEKRFKLRTVFLNLPTWL